MLRAFKLPLGWFTEKYSRLACVQMGIRIIPVKDWITLDLFMGIVLPEDFDLLTYLRADKLDGLIFIFDGETDVLIHPDKIFKLSKKGFRELYKRNRVLIH